MSDSAFRHLVIVILLAILFFVLVTGIVIDRDLQGLDVDLQNIYDNQGPR